MGPPGGVAGLLWLPPWSWPGPHGGRHDGLYLRVGPPCHPSPPGASATAHVLPRDGLTETWMGTGPGGSGTSSCPHAPSGGLGLHRSLTPVSGGGWTPAGQHCRQGGEGQLCHAHGTGSSRGRRVRTPLGAGAGEPWSLHCLAVLEPPEKHLETTADGPWGLVHCSVMTGRSVTGGHPVTLSECSHS